MQKGTSSDSLAKCLSSNVHIGLQSPPDPRGETVTVTGDYLYFHYGCDGLDDRGWGCGYRTVQTMASWLFYNCALTRGRHTPAPGLPDIQQALVCMGDKEQHFSGSRDWIGTVEASLVLDYFYDVPCKVAHVRGGDLERAVVEELLGHFERQGSPVMMGGGTDSSSKGVLGVCSNGAHGSSLLVVDPHYYGTELDGAELQRRGWVAWTPLSSMDHSSFYNLCLPQTGHILNTLKS